MRSPKGICPSYTVGSSRSSSSIDGSWPFNFDGPASVIVVGGRLNIASAWPQIQYNMTHSYNTTSYIGTTSYPVVLYFRTIEPFELEQHGLVSDIGTGSPKSRWYWRAQCCKCCAAGAVCKGCSEYPRPRRHALDACVNTIQQSYFLASSSAYSSITYDYNVPFQTRHFVAFPDAVFQYWSSMHPYCIVKANNI